VSEALAWIGVKPHRTIRVALWSGEEQGLLGSQAYVKEHFGMVENAKPEHAERQDAAAANAVMAQGLGA
jgi:Zn-dependent M28 family amino/carboxypeptidase